MTLHHRIRASTVLGSGRAMPRITVVIPTYRRPQLLSEAIRSVLNQTYQDFEIVVVDDNSGDDTEKVVRAFGEARVRYIAHETNKRCGAGKNTGIRNSESELIAFLDDDDEWLPPKLERQVAVLDRSPATTGLVYAGFHVIDRSTGLLLRTVVPRKAGACSNTLAATPLGRLRSCCCAGPASPGPASLMRPWSSARTGTSGSASLAM